MPFCILTLTLPTMLQFIAQENEKYSIPEQIQMAIEGGCAWVQLRLHDMPDDEIRPLAQEVVPLCRETSTILTIDDHIHLAQELGIHGVQLIDSEMEPAQVRELFGPEAIIGVQVREASQVVPLARLDIDYVTFSPTPLARLGEYVEAIRNDNISLPIVAEGEFTLDQLTSLLRMGVNGVALSHTISDAHDPVAATRQILDVLSAAAK